MGRIPTYHSRKPQEPSSSTDIQTTQADKGTFGMSLGGDGGRGGDDGGGGGGGAGGAGGGDGDGRRLRVGRERGSPCHGGSGVDEG